MKYKSHGRIGKEQWKQNEKAKAGGGNRKPKAIIGPESECGKSKPKARTGIGAESENTK